MKEKSLLITNDFPPIVSGISTAFYQLWRYLPNERIVVMAPKTNGSAEFDDGQTFIILRKWLPVGESNIAKLVKSVLVTLRALYVVPKYRARKLHCGQILSAGLAGLVCKRIFGAPYAVYVYGSETSRFSGSKLIMRFINKIIAEADELVTNSEYTSQEFLRLGIDPAKIVKVLPGVDTAVFYPKPKSDELIKKYNLEGCKVLLTVGRLDERKGHDAVIQALPKAIERFPETRYLIVGGGREEGRLRSLAKELGLVGSDPNNTKVIFTGYVPNDKLADYYNLCDVFVMPNRETTENKQLKGDLEGFGIVFMEAGACAKPVIVGRSGGTEEAVEDGVTGLFVDPNSIGNIAETIITLLGDTSFAAKLGKAGEERAKTQLDCKIIAQSVLKIL